MTGQPTKYCKYCRTQLNTWNSDTVKKFVLWSLSVLGVGWCGPYICMILLCQILQLYIQQFVQCMEMRYVSKLWFSVRPCPLGGMGSTPKIHQQVTVPSLLALATAKVWRSQVEKLWRVGPAPLDCGVGLIFCWDLHVTKMN